MVQTSTKQPVLAVPCASLTTPSQLHVAPVAIKHMHPEVPESEEQMITDS